MISPEYRRKAKHNKRQDGEGNVSLALRAGALSLFTHDMFSAMRRTTP